MSGDPIPHETSIIGNHKPVTDMSQINTTEILAESETNRAIRLIDGGDETIVSTLEPEL